MIYKEKIPRTDLRLGRNVEHDSMSLDFTFDTAGLQIINVEHTRLVPVFNQGQVGSCTGNAGIGAINTSPFIQNQMPYYSPDETGALKLYNEAERIDGGIGYPPEDAGSSGLSIAKALTNAGVISSYQHTFTLNDALMALSKYPIIVGIPWYTAMFNPDADGRVHPTGNIAGGHEIEAFKVDVDNGRVWFWNSWGSSWGVNGTFYLTWQDFNTLLSQQGDVVVLIPPAIPVPTPIPTYLTLKLGSKGSAVMTLQTDLNKFGAALIVDGNFGKLTQLAVIVFQTKNGLVADGIVGQHTWQVLSGANQNQSIIDIITNVCNDNGIDPLIFISVVACESSFNPNAKLFNPGSNSTDRGLLQWNSKYHAEISDADAFDPTKAIEWGCKYLKENKANLHGFWSASQSCWIKKLTPAIITEYGL